MKFTMMRTTITGGAILFCGALMMHRVSAHTLREKIAQLMVVDVSPALLRREISVAVLHDACARKAAGIFINPMREAICSKDFLELREQFLAMPGSQSMLIGMDCEWGPGMRFSDFSEKPRAGVLGKEATLDEIRAIGYAIGNDIRSFGIHWGALPVLDVNTNPNNPVIGPRAFSDNPDTVIACARAFIEGLHAAGMVCTGKHFPGHGDTHADSHFSLPVVTCDLSPHLAPYYALADVLDSVMMAHLIAVDIDPELPASLSPKAVALARSIVGNDCLIMTDALDMNALDAYGDQADRAVLALAAGNDLVLFVGDLGVAIDRVVAAVAAGIITEEAINEHLRRVRLFKKKCGIPVS